MNVDMYRAAEPDDQNCDRKADPNVEPHDQINNVSMIHLLCWFLRSEHDTSTINEQEG